MSSESKDFEYIRSLSEPVTVRDVETDEVLKVLPAGGEFGHINDGLTRAFDGLLWSPDEVDAFDASCNTCRHFVRKPMTPEEKRERNLYGMPGQCQLKQIPVSGWQRGQFCGLENGACYENRRTGMKHAEACRPREEKAVVYTEKKGGE